MPKVKTRKAAKKRFKLTATGKVRFQRAGLRHNLENMSGKEKRHASQEGELSPEHVANVKRLLGKR
ncbi:MAG: 50S ribosomal protein L35 [Thermoleophilia bacterium]